jgi:hypothetical protein
MEIPPHSAKKEIDPENAFNVTMGDETKDYNLGLPCADILSVSQNHLA